MTADSDKALLERLSQASVLNDWGAMLAMGQAPLNRTLHEQFVDGFGDSSFLDPMNIDRAELDEGGQVTVSLHGLVLGAPQLSFEKAAVGGANATVRFNVIAGEYVRELAPPTQPAIVKESFSIAEQMGYHVEAQVTLGVNRSPGSRVISIGLGLEQARDFTCNFGSTSYIRTLIARRIQRLMQDQPAYRQHYPLVAFDADDYRPLSPRRVELQTMAAPANDGAEGDGALLLFLQLGVNVLPGSLPGPGSDFPYPIPDDPALVGTLLVNAAVVDLGVDDGLKVLQSHRIYNDYAFVETARSSEGDLAIFGHWQPSAATLNVEPALSTLAAGASQTLSSQGEQAPERWTASNIRRPLVTGTLADSTYSARSRNEFVQDRQLVAVTAHYPRGHGEARRSALMVEAASAVSVAPRAVTWARGHAPIELSAASSAGGQLSWSLVGTVQDAQGPAREAKPAKGGAEILDDLGTLEDLGDGRARFTPRNPTSGTPEIRLQRIKVTDRQSGESAESAVVIVAWPQSMTVTPSHVPQLGTSQVIPFRLHNSSRRVTWHVFGEGTIDADGNYTPPATPTLPASVVMADYDGEDTGYALVEFSQHRVATSASGHWKAISNYKLETLGGSSCFANGMQQIVLQVTLTTATVDGISYPISDEELATLTVYSSRSKNPIEFLDPDADGMDLDDPAMNNDWRINRLENTFRPSATRVVTADPHNNPGTRIVTFYIHTTAVAEEDFYVGLQNRLDYTWHFSTDHGEGGTIRLQGLGRPTFASESYAFTRQRISGVSPVQGDEFDYVDGTVDYWRLTHVIRADKILKFVRLRISSDQNTSMVRWESEQYEETHASWTGLAFNPLDGARQDKALVFDGLLHALAKARDLSLSTAVPDGKSPSPGELIISLHRTANLKYWDDKRDGKPYRARLDRPLLFDLLDQEGNLHKLRIAFGTGSRARNELLLTV